MRLLTLSAALFSLTCTAQPDTLNITSFCYDGPHPMPKPLLTDSTDIKGKPFSTASFLAYLPDIPNWKADHTLCATELPVSNTYALHSAGVYLTCEGYATAQIKATAPKDHNVYIDGKKVVNNQLKLTPGTHRLEVRMATEPDQKAPFAIKLFDNKGAHISASTNVERIYTQSDAMCGKRIGNVSMSADGKYIIINYSITDTNGASWGENTLYEVATGRRTSIAGSPLWMKTGHHYLLLKSFDSKRTIVSVDAETGQETIVADNVPSGTSLSMLKGNNLLVYSSERADAPAPDVYRQYEPSDRRPVTPTGYQYGVYDITTGIYRPVLWGKNKSTSVTLSDDGSHLLVNKRTRDITRRPESFQSVIRVDLATLKADTLIRENGFIGSVLPDVYDGNMYLTASPEAFSKGKFDTRTGFAPSSYHNELYRMKAATGDVEKVLENFNPSINSIQWHTPSKAIYMLTTNKDSVTLFRTTPKGKAEMMPVPEEVIHRISIAAETNKMAVVGSSVSNEQRLYIMDTKSKKCQLIEDMNEAIMKDIQLGKCENYNYINSRGDTIYGRFYLPPHFDAGKRYPLIVYYYGGCTPTSRAMTGFYSHHAYAAQGYVVYVIQPSGTIGFGKDFADRHVNAWGDYTADDIIGGVKQFCTDHPYVNPKKIGCLGASYGGFMTQTLVTKTDLFAAAISHAGISNIASYWGVGYWGYSYSFSATADAYPWNNPDLYTQHSPLFNADKVHTPLLFVHGTSDTNVPPGESQQMFTALKILGRETAYVHFKGEDHHILDFHKRVKWTNTMFAWFAKWLKDDPLWWDTLYPEQP